ncbi:cuticle protein 16.5 [Episyrphus balteatus]|uniref:cuticle protein 16.5 n=1 Tax=Episyrphus balteatus TaxID=286459 RepID=UPI0024858E46|nr:cuticle protein 16.5 [Episyrphus balteatus]
MAFKVIFVITAIVACVQAGGPAAYSISAPSIDHGSVGQSQEHTIKGHYGQNSQSDYSSQVTAGHAVSHVSRSSTTNDAQVVAPSYGGHLVQAAHAISAPAIAHSYAPAIAHGYAAAPAQYYSHGYAASAPVLSHGYASAPSYISAGPAISHGYHSYAAAPAIQSYIAQAPATLKLAPAPAYSSGYIQHAPAYSQSYVSAPQSYKIAASPAIGYAAHAPHGLGLGLAAAHYAAPAYAAPAYAAHAYAPAPALIKAAPALVHTSVAGHGIHYAY